MRNLLALMAVLFLGFAGTSYFRGWCNVSTLPADTGKSAFRVEIDRDRIATDFTEAAKAVQHFLRTDQNDSTEKAKPAEGDKTSPPPVAIP
jgi:hypothetical protein